MLDRRGPADLEQAAADPRAQSLAARLRDPKARERLEKAVGAENLAKLDKIFNAQPEGMPPVPEPLGPALPKQ